MREWRNNTRQILHPKQLLNREICRKYYDNKCVTAPILPAVKLCGGEKVAEDWHNKRHALYLK